MLKLRSDNRIIGDGEIDTLIKGITEAIPLLNDLRDNNSVIQEGLHKMNIRQLEGLVEVMPSGSGSQTYNSLDNIGQAVFPIIQKVENAIDTLKSLFVDLTAEFRTAYAREHHAMKPEYAQFDHVSFKEVVLGTIKIKKEALAQENIRTRVHEMKQQNVAAMNTQIEAQARAYAQQLFEQHMAQMAADRADVEM